MNLKDKQLSSFGKHFPTSPLAAEEPTAEDECKKETARSFLTDYADSDSIYDDL